MGQCVWLGALRSQRTQVCSPAAEEEAGTGRGNQGGGLGTKPPLCGPDTQWPQCPRETWSSCPETEQSCHFPSPNCVCCSCSLFVFGHPLGDFPPVKALRAQTHRVSYISTPMIIHPVISDWSVVFITCYSSVSCLKCFQSRHRKSCPVPNQKHTHTQQSSLAQSTSQTSW